MFNYNDTERINSISAPAKAGVPSPDDEKLICDYPLKDNAGSFCGMRFIGITGTNGKTTTAYLTSQMLFAAGINVACIGTLGFFYNTKKVRDLKNTTPQNAELYSIISEAKEFGASVVVMEISSHALYFDRIDGIELDVAAFTNLTEDHLDIHLTMENYLHTKMLIKDKLKKNGRMIVNADDPAYKYFTTENTGLVGIEKGDYNIVNYEFGLNCTDMILEVGGHSYKIRTNLSRKFNLYNYTIALAIVNSLGVDIEDIVKTGKDILPPPGRNEVFNFRGGLIILDFANTPDAVYQILSAYSENRKGRIITITGCGGDRDIIKRSLIGGVVTELSDWVIFTNNDPRTEEPANIMNDITANLKKDNYGIIYDRASAIKKGINMMGENDIVLVLGKGHEDYHLVGNGRVPYSDKEEILKNIIPFFSVIVTAYNIERYITDCIESIKGQTFENYECIIVDDGSDDETGKVIADAIAEDSRFTYIRTAHKGQSHARNTGLKASCGKFVLFTDGDDTLTGDCLAGCAGNSEACDMLFFGINYREYAGEKLVKEQPTKLPEMEFSSGATLTDWYVVHHKLLLYSAANKVYNRSVLEKNAIYFDETLSFGEDRKFNYDFLKVSGKIRILPDVYYNYRKINSSSLTSVFRPHHIDECLYLHNLKMQHIWELSKNTTPSEKEAFEQFDLNCEIRRSIRHIKEHSDRLSKDVQDDEYDYLASKTPLKHFILADADDSKKNRIMNYENQIRSFEDSYAIKTIIGILDDAIETSGLKHLKKFHNCQNVYSFIKQFDTRKGERQQSEISADAFKINKLLNDSLPEIYFAFNQLGFIRNNRVNLHKYDFILIAGGGNDANRQRTVKAKTVADNLSEHSVSAGMIAALSAYRKIGENEAEYIKDYAFGLDNEFDVITECLDNIFFKKSGEKSNRTVLSENRNTDPTLSCRIIEFDKKYGSSTVRAYCAPKREKSRARADTRDCLEFFFDNTVVPENSDILLVTSNPYCTSQFTADIAIEHKINLDIVGCAPDELCIRPDSINCAKYLNELIKTYFEFERFRKEYGSVIYE